MQDFIDKHNKDIVCTLSGLDRLVLVGYLQILCHVPGVMDWLKRSGVLFKDFGRFVEEKTQQLKEASLAEARRLQRPIEYLSSPKISKEERAQEIAERDGIDQGLICVLTAVEPCMSFEVQRNRQSQHATIERAIRKCLFLYHYWIDPVFGFMHARIQTWFPFRVRICLNGREWLSRQMDAEGLEYQKHQNCFLHLQDPQRAQQLMDRQLKTNWPEQCRRMAQQLNPAFDDIFEKYQVAYSWSTYQSEWATDLLFRSQQALNRLYEGLVGQAIMVFDSPDVLRFLGKKMPHFQGETHSSYLRRPEGLRIKHRVKSNSIKMYDKGGQILRLETTIQDPYDFKVYRRAQGRPDSPLKWRRMRKGVADLYARCCFSEKCNQRYLQALADLQVSQPIRELLAEICTPTRWKKNRFRGLLPWSSDEQDLLQAVSRPELQLRGFRNRDLVHHLFGPDIPPSQRSRLASWMTYRLRLLRAHGLIRKIPRSHRYRLTQKGRQILPPLIQVYHMDTEQLTQLAA